MMKLITFLLFIASTSLGTGNDLPLEPVASIAVSKDQNGALTVALLQMSPDKDKVSANFAKAEQYCRRAAAAGADVALMPELWSTGYTGFDRKKPGARQAFQAKAISKESPAVQHFATLAQELHMAIGVTYLQTHAPAPRDAITLFDRDGREVFTYAKIHTCDFSVMEAAMDPGDDFHVGNLDTKNGTVRVGAMICFDREQPESARILMIKGAEIILTPNACQLDTLRLDQFKIRAWENAVGVAMANYPEPTQNGNSIAFDAEGKCLAKAEAKEDMVLAQFDLGKIRARRKSSVWGNAYRRPQRYDLLTAPEKDTVWSRTNRDGTVFDASKR
jgi:predicted amidohydrolase